MFVHIISNSLGSGDYVIVVLEGDVIFEGHRLTPANLVEISMSVNGFEHLHYHELTDAQMENWEAVVFEDVEHQITQHKF